MSAAFAWKAIATTFVVSLGLLCFISPAMADATNGSAPAVEWQSTYGAAGSEVGYNAVPTADGGYLVLGVTRSYGNGSYDAWLIKIDARGREAWNRTYGGSGGDWLYGIAPTTDGNFVMGGATNSFGAGGFDIWLVKVDGNGGLLWSKTFGGPNNDAGFSVAVASDGGYAVTGYWSVTAGDSDFTVIRTDRDGNPDWDRMYKHGVQDWGKSIVATSDGGFAIAGWTVAASGEKARAYLLKVDTNGIEQWGQAFGGSAGDSYGYGVIETDDGGYILSGHTNAIGAGGIDYYLVKVGANGRTQWERAYGKAGDDYCFGVIPVADGYYLGGHSTSLDASLARLYLIKIGKDGGMIEARGYGPEKTSVKGGLSLLTPDNGYLFVGNTNEYGSGKDDVFVLKLRGDAAVPAPAADDTGQKATLAVAAVATGTGLSFLALFMGRIFDYIGATMNRVSAGIGDLWGSLVKVPVIEALYKFVYGYVYGRFKSKVVGLLSSRLKKAEAAEGVPFLAGFSSRELAVLSVSAVLLGLAFIVAKKMDLASLDNLVLYIVMAGFVTSLHDLAHRYYAFKYKSIAEYKFWGFGTLIMFLTAIFLGVTYAVPARTIIDKADKMSLKEQAIVYLSGPMVSLILTIAFLLLVPLGGMLKTIGLLGVSMNLMSAVYSLTPFTPMDGNKVFKWKRALWALTFVPLLLLYLWVTVFVQ